MKRLVVDEPELRFQHSYNGTDTVLEGEELQHLLSRFFWHNSRLTAQSGDAEKAFVSAVIRAYQGLYGEDVVLESDLRDLATADARKMDLLYKGLLLLLLEARYPDENWERQLLRNRGFGATLNEILIIKPNLFGLGVDIKAVWRGALRK